MALVIRELGRCDYASALALQEELVGRKLRGDTADYLLVMEHDPVYTLGRGADARDLLNATALGVPTFRVSRGGGVTFHGPGQLVAYPILTLSRGGRDVHRYVRRLEQVLIDACARFGVRAARRVGMTGVWVDGAKVASIGIGVRRWTTFHGVALNVATDLRFFEHIVPCRMPEVRMTSLARLLPSPPTMAAVRAVMVERFRDTFGSEGGTARECA